MRRFVLVLAATTTLLTGCSLFPSGEMDYKAASSLPPLRVPESLSPPARDNRYSIPGIDDLADLATASSLSAKRRVLPKGSVTVREDEGLRWLEISEPAEQVWNLLVAYWMEQKAPLVESDPRKGVIRTDWIVRTPGASKKKIVRDQYRMRLERAGEGSRVYVSHFATGKSAKQEDGVQWTLLPSEEERKTRILGEVAEYLVKKN